MGLEKQHFLDNIFNVKVPFAKISTFSLPDHSIWGVFLYFLEDPVHLYSKLSHCVR